MNIEEVVHEGDVIVDDIVSFESFASSRHTYDSTVLYTNRYYFLCDYSVVNWWGKVGDKLWL